ncbi:MAG: FAD-binding oxidoreductase [Symploca sp. SIO2B6]|nr:FAD-binding oxidoreductase [Symploca sp. SIO2B6]
MSRVLIIGCGIVGAAIAYELSTIAGLDVTLIDRQPPAQESTGAALGVLMGVISQKKQGRGWHLRELSLQQYETWIPQLEAETGQIIPFNRDGLVLLTVDRDDMTKWEKLRSRRQSQGWSLEIWDRAQLCDRIPLIGQQLNGSIHADMPLEHHPEAITGAIYSPHDRQVDPVALTQALVTVSQHRGVAVHTDMDVQAIQRSPSSQHSYVVQTSEKIVETDWIIIAAGLGSTVLAKSLAQSLEQSLPRSSASSPVPSSAQSVDIRPVLGQAIHLRLPPTAEPRPNATDFRPVMIGDGINVVPVSPPRFNEYSNERLNQYSRELPNEYWVGATVEFPDESGKVKADNAQLKTLLERAIAFYPPLAQGDIVYQWSGCRPRPFGRPAPIIESLPDHPRVILATGHYRNGVLLAPATAHLIRDMITVS